jgi:hypothetical protein
MTNGRTQADDGRAADAEADAQAARDNDEDPGEIAPEEDRPPTDADYGVAFSPRQVAGGFAILAALLVIIARRHRRKKG